MPKRYQDIYPEAPLMSSSQLLRGSASDLLSLEFFEAQPATMPAEVFEQHHILINLNDKEMRVENWRDDEHRDFTYRLHEVVVTPVGVRSGWRWYEKSKCIVVTLEPEKLEAFARTELGMLLSSAQLSSVAQFVDQDLCESAVMLRDAMTSQFGSAVMFESFARIFLVKLLQTYGLEQQEEMTFSKRFTSKHYKRVLEYVSSHFGKEISVDALAECVGLSVAHFSRLFKKTIGQTPHQFVTAYRVEQAKKMLSDPYRSIIDVALSCGFADQAHFSRVFKQWVGTHPKGFRDGLA